MQHRALDEIKMDAGCVGFKQFLEKPRIQKSGEFQTRERVVDAAVGNCSCAAV